MHVSIFDQYGALNSSPVFSAIRSGLTSLGFATSSHDNNADVAVIWSYLWAGRMKPNQAIYNLYRSTGRNVLIAEVGMLKRGITWKLCLNSTTNTGNYGAGFDTGRAQALGLHTQPWRNTGQNIVIAMQRDDSGQWTAGCSATTWLQTTITQLRQHTDRNIVVRPHPRQKITVPGGVIVQSPRMIATDSFDFDQALSNAWAVVNFNSGPGSQAIINGIPSFVDQSSLAAPVGNLNLADIEKPTMPDRQTWLDKIAHTEWTVEEISSGLPLARIFQSS